MQEGLHDGHRERLINKFAEFPDSFSDHELLEIFLYTVVPRKDTNALAHRLIKAFGSLKKVFSATAEQLTAVEGVGKAIAAQIVLHAKIMDKISALSSEKAKAFSSPERIKRELVALFDGVKGEKFYFFLLSDTFEQVLRLEFVGKTEEAVFADTTEIARAMSVNKAKFALIAHNHPSGNPSPSEADDIATSKFYIVCEVHGVKLADHVIVAGQKTYSYFAEKRLDYIKERVKADKLI